MRDFASNDQLLEFAYIQTSKMACAPSKIVITLHFLQEHNASIAHTSIGEISEIQNTKRGNTNHAN